MKQNKKVDIHDLARDMERDCNIEDGPDKFSEAIIEGQKQESAGYYNSKKTR